MYHIDIRTKWSTFKVYYLTVVTVVEVSQFNSASQHL